MLFRSGELFESGNGNSLKREIRKLWKRVDLIEKYQENCKGIDFDAVEEYCKKLVGLYSLENW